MPQYLAPGVYVEEVESGAKPIAGVGTSTAGFVGVVADTATMPLLPGAVPGSDGSYSPEDYYQLTPADTPVLITTWQEFQNSFGGIQTSNMTLAHSVYGFFNNGGTRCWIIRVAAAGSDLFIAALEKFEAIDEIAIVAIPGVTDDAVQNALLDHCEKPFLQDRFAILDGRQTTNLTKAGIQGGVRDSSYGAIYFPWIQVFDPASNQNAIVPPSGHLAGAYARVDSLRGVHKAPANEVLRGALGVQTNVSREQQAGLNPEDINVIRVISGNVTVWGAHTLAGKENAEWRYINVRRLFLFLRESIEEGTQWVVFEPNNASLWGQITRNVTAFLTNVWRDGALFGTTPQEAFFVKCDAETNPPEVRDLGQVVTEVGVAVAKPAEFVIFRISQSVPQGG